MQQFPMWRKMGRTCSDHKIVEQSLVISRNGQGMCIMASATVHLGPLTTSGHVHRLGQFPCA